MRSTLRLSPESQGGQVILDMEDQRVDVHLSRSGKTLVCPETGKPGTLNYYRNERSSRHPDWFQCRCFIRGFRFLSGFDVRISACQKMILVVGLYDEFGYLGADLIILGGFGQDLACIWGSDRIGVVRAGG